MSRYYVIISIGTCESHDILPLYRIWTDLLKLFISYWRNIPTSQNIWTVLSLTVFKYFSGLQRIAQGEKSIRGELLEQWLPIWAWEWDWGLSSFLDDLKSFFGLFVNKGVRLMAYARLWTTLSQFLAMFKYRLKLSPNMDIRCPRHGTRAMLPCTIKSVE